jgi:hypothetical protein
MLDPLDVPLRYDNADFDITDMFNKLCVEHHKGNTWVGADFANEGVADTIERFGICYVMARVICSDKKISTAYP